MTVSVAIATYNRKSMVGEAVRAAFAQSRPPEEVVVSDDASTDGTVAAVEELAQRERRLRLIRQERNSGGVVNWNRAMAATRGNLIAWCSDDDRFLPDHLEASAAYLETVSST
jgi:glycosyltransferase involved in cell wall biosynthesis